MFVLRALYLVLCALCIVHCALCLVPCALCLGLWLCTYCFVLRTAKRLRPKAQGWRFGQPWVTGLSYTNPERVAPSFALDCETYGHNRVAVDIHTHPIPQGCGNPGL